MSHQQPRFKGNKLRAKLHYQRVGTWQMEGPFATIFANSLPHSCSVVPPTSAGSSSFRYTSGWKLLLGNGREGAQHSNHLYFSLLVSFLQNFLQVPSFSYLWRQPFLSQKDLASSLHLPRGQWPLWQGQGLQLAWWPWWSLRDDGKERKPVCDREAGLERDLRPLIWRKCWREGQGRVERV